MKHKKNQIHSDIRWDSWIKFNGEHFHGHCFCCDTNITVRNFQSGHIKSHKYGGSNHINNLQPICAQCNNKGGMGTQHMYEYIIKYGKKGIKNLSAEEIKTYTFEVNYKNDQFKMCSIKYTN